jgi:hypothetical protein
MHVAFSNAIPEGSAAPVSWPSDSSGERESRWRTSEETRTRLVDAEYGVGQKVVKELGLITCPIMLAILPTAEPFPSSVLWLLIPNRRPFTEKLKDLIPPRNSEMELRWNSGWVWGCPISRAIMPSGE